MAICLKCKLQSKLVLSFLLMILMISGLTFFVTYHEVKNQIKDIIRSDLMNKANIIAMSINGDLHESLNPGDEGTEGYKQIQDILSNARERTDSITYIYTMRRTSTGVEFVVDADLGKGTPGEETYIGYNYDDTTPELLLGFEHPDADREFATDNWGTFLSGYAPIKNSKGENVGLVGIDMRSDDVIKKQNFIGYTMFFMVGIAILIACLIIWLFSATIKKDIKKLNQAAEKISTGDMDVTIDVKRSDEIGELAESFSRMAASLKIMMHIQKKKK
ncbi:HAMP domain-containing protein [Candidatus Woesearchaeota archaeon]|nr:HAMP domain-containing protein [Candidatus Woesearchaeota archaeon]